MEVDRCRPQQTLKGMGQYSPQLPSRFQHFLFIVRSPLDMMDRRGRAHARQRDWKWVWKWGWFNTNWWMWKGRRKDRACVCVYACVSQGKGELHAREWKCRWARLWICITNLASVSEWIRKCENSTSHSSLPNTTSSLAYCLHVRHSLPLLIDDSQLS